MSAGNSPRVRATSREILITRVFDAPRDLVFRAWTDPERLKNWWSPKGWTTPFCTVDLRRGGRFLSIPGSAPIAPDKGNPVPPSHYGMSESHPAETVVAVTFTEHAGRTKVTLRHSMSETVVEREGTRQGWNEMFDRLASILR